MTTWPSAARRLRPSSSPRRPRRSGTPSTSCARSRPTTISPSRSTPTCWSRSWSGSSPVVNARPISVVVRIARHDFAGAVELPVLQPVDLIAGLGALPAFAGIGTDLRAEGVALDAPGAAIGRRFDRAIGPVEFVVAAGRLHRALHGIADDERTQAVAGER